jgi:hypothetical protein
MKTFLAFVAAAITALLGVAFNRQLNRRGTTEKAEDYSDPQLNAIASRLNTADEDNRLVHNVWFRLV